MIRKILNDYYSHLNSLKLDLGSGIYPKEGYIGLDNFVGIKAQTLDIGSVDKSKLNVIQHNLQEGIPFENDSIDAVITSHFLEHCGALDTLFEEVNRVLKRGHIFEIIIPYANSAEGMFPGHNIFFTEDWFLKNILFNKFFKIKEIIFYESEHYSKNKEKINKLFTFHEARTFLFNCCWQMQIISERKKDDGTHDNSNVKYGVVSFSKPFLKTMSDFTGNGIKRKLIKKVKDFLKV